MNDLLSQEALKWLKSLDYANRSHEERMILLKVARIIFQEE